MVDHHIKWMPNAYQIQYLNFASIISKYIQCFYRYAVRFVIATFILTKVQVFITSTTRLLWFYRQCVTYIFGDLWPIQITFQFTININTVVKRIITSTSILFFYFYRYILKSFHTARFRSSSQDTQIDNFEIL